MKKYPNLEKRMAKKGLPKYKIAKEINMEPRVFTKKLKGETPFTWEEACCIHHCFFKEETMEELFTLGKEEKQQKSWAVIGAKKGGEKP